MIRMHSLPDAAALSAIETGEFPPEITGAERVAVVMTQSWCPDWLRMNTWLTGFERQEKPADRDIDVYVLVYNKADYFQDFLRLKENGFGNDEIPYVRYYRDGAFTGDSNYLPRGGFLARFGE